MPFYPESLPVPAELRAGEWAFSRIHFTANDQDARQMEMFTNAGFQPRYSMSIPKTTGKFILYG